MAKNIDESKVLLDTIKQLNKTLEVQEINTQINFNAQQQMFNKAIKNSKLDDDRLITLLDEQSKASGEYKKRVDMLVSEYINEQKYSKSQQEELNKILSESKKLQEVQVEQDKQARKREVRDNPLNAFSHFAQDYKKSKNIKESASNLGSGLKEGIKSKMNFKSITKGLLHTAGVATDMPALNILASEIGSSVKKREEVNTKLNDLTTRLKASESNKTNPSSSIDNFDDAVKEEGTRISDTKEMLQSINNNAENIYVDLGATLEDIKQENKEHTKFFREMLFMQKDMMDDAKSKSSSISASSASLETTEPEKGDDLDIIGGFGGKNKGKTKGKSRIPKLGNLARMAGRFLKIAGPIGAGLGAIASSVSGFLDTAENFNLQNGEKATIAQKTSSTLAGIASGLTFGLVDEKNASSAISSFGNTIASPLKSIGSSSNSNGLVDQLEQAGVIDTSLIGDSQIRNWDAIKQLSPQQIKDVLGYNDWDSATEDKLKSLITPIKANVQQQADITKVPSSVTTADIQAPKSAPVVVSQPAPVASQAPVVVPVTDNGNKIDNYSIDSKDLLTIMTLHGIRV